MSFLDRQEPKRASRKAGPFLLRKAPMVPSQINQIQRDIHSLEIAAKRSEAKGNAKKTALLRGRIELMEDMVSQLRGLQARAA